MGSRIARAVETTTHRLRTESVAFTTNNTSAPSSSLFKGPISGVTRTGTGVHRIILKESFPNWLTVIPFCITTAGVRVVVKAQDLDAVGGGTIDLETRTQDAGDATDPGYLTAQAVASNAHTAASAGWVTFVEATAGSTTGVFSILRTGTPNTTEVTVTYTSGVPTLTFAAGDAVTECAYTLVTPGGASETVADTTSVIIGATLMAVNSAKTVR